MRPWVLPGLYYRGILRLYRDDGQANGNYYLRFGVKDLGCRVTNRVAKCRSCH